MFDLERYLARICYDGPRSLSKETLNALIHAHLEAVPFENLDIYDVPQAISLELPDLFDKIVVRRRGGFCFELNTLFFALLQAFGFQAYPVAARVVWRRDYTPPLSHRATVVALDGQQWFCDVGFGGPGPKGVLCISDEERQLVAGESFCVQTWDGVMCICRLEQAKWSPVLAFRNEAFEEVDYPPLCHYFSTSPKSTFTQNRVVNLCRPDGHLSLSGDVLTIRRGGEIQTVTLTDAADRERVLREEFGLILDR